MRKTVCTMLLVLAAFAIPAFAGDDKKTTQQPPMDPGMQAMMTAMTPGEHHEHLKKLAGKHDYTMKMWMDPSAPPTESTGKRNAEMILGGRGVASSCPSGVGATAAVRFAPCFRSIVFFLSLSACFSTFSIERVNARYISALTSLAVKV